MYLTRILVTVLILMPLTLVAKTTTNRTISGKPTTTGKPNTPGKLYKTTSNHSMTKASTSKNGIVLKLGENLPPNNNRSKIISTRFGSNGNPEEGCLCMLYYLCDRSEIVTGQQCEDNSNVCCRVSTYEDSVPDKWSTSSTQKLPSNSQSNCICVPTTQCGNPLVVKAGAELIDPRFPCQSWEICCPPESIIRGVVWSSPVDTIQPKPIPDPPVNLTPLNPPTDISSGECGIRRHPLDVDVRIAAPERIDSAETSFGEFPWMALILASEIAPDGTVTENVFVCGASLLSPSVVLTAAHCVAHLSPDRLRIRVGEYNTNQVASEPMIHQDRPVSRIIVHPGFNNRTLFNDIALIRVSEDFSLAPHIAPICLPVTNSQFADPGSYDPNNCLATGWGKDAFAEGNYQTTLKKVDLALIEQSECQNSLRKTKLGRRFNLNPSFICAGGQAGHDTCEGDGGGPLVCASRDNPNKYIQVGIVSWGLGCATNVPGVYASLYANREWLTSEYNQ